VFGNKNRSVKRLPVGIGTGKFALCFGVGRIYCFKNLYFSAAQRKSKGAE